jgi:hypothetical protein
MPSDVHEDHADGPGDNCVLASTAWSDAPMLPSAGCVICAGAHIDMAGQKIEQRTLAAGLTMRIAAT